jgi:hypothetical protein
MVLDSSVITIDATTITTTTTTITNITTSPFVMILHQICLQQMKTLLSSVLIKMDVATSRLFNLQLMLLKVLARRGVSYGLIPAFTSMFPT